MRVDRGVILWTRSSMLGAIAGALAASAYLILDPGGVGARIVIAGLLGFAGLATGLLASCRRRDARRRSEILNLREELRASQDHIMEIATYRSLGAYLEIAAHQMKEPLRDIVAGSEALSSSLSPDGKARAHVENLSLRIRELEAILRHLASYSLTKPGRAPFSVNTLLQHAILLCRHRAEEKRIRIEEHYAVIPPVFGPAERIEGAILNVLINAVESIPFEGGTIRIETRHEGERVVARVIDTGIGVKPEHLGKVFDPFFTTKPDKSGGLGLWAAKQMLDIIGADIQVESSPFEGTRVTLTFQQAAPLRPGREGTAHPQELSRNTAEERGRQIA